ncbi:MAG TPA: hypothetical protein VMM18_14720 [Gemmatimonadaceae bacterium]|nr:hypothetical protein [Gemmatimonadaceae bacterium]
MNHRHLLPDELDLLLDGEVGFGVAPLRAHVEQCTDCRTRLDESRSLVESLERLPEVAPSPLFASRVMANVNVFVPWHVAARDAAVRWVPASRPMRVLAGAMATTVALVLSLGSVWLASRFDLLVFFVSGVALDRARELAFAVADGTLASLFGEAAAQAILGGGTLALALAFLATMSTAVLAVFGLRRLVVAHRRPG